MENDPPPNPPASDLPPPPQPDSPLASRDQADPLDPARAAVQNAEVQAGSASGPPAPATTQDERVVSAFAHLMAFFSFAWIPLFINLAIYIMWKDRSSYVRFQSAQALGYILALASLSWLTFTVFTASFFLWCLLPAGLILVVLGHIYALWAAASTLGGQPFVYLGLGPVVKGLLDPPSS
jgi:uncharacterized Tic20 family protein